MMRDSKIIGRRTRRPSPEAYVANRIARAACAIMQSGRPYDPRHRELPA